MPVDLRDLPFLAPSPPLRASEHWFGVNSGTVVKMMQNVGLNYSQGVQFCPGFCGALGQGLLLMTWMILT